MLTICPLKHEFQESINTGLFMIKSLEPRTVTGKYGSFKSVNEQTGSSHYKLSIILFLSSSNWQGKKRSVTDRLNPHCCFSCSFHARLFHRPPALGQRSALGYQLRPRWQSHNLQNPSTLRNCLALLSQQVGNSLSYDSPMHVSLCDMRSN